MASPGPTRFAPSTSTRSQFDHSLNAQIDQIPAQVAQTTERVKNDAVPTRVSVGSCGAEGLDI